jgi:dihydrolipoamide dehydrogenase
MALQEIQLPDIGDFKGVEIIEILVQPGDRVEKDQSLMTLESDKASMEIPSPAAGVVKEWKVKLGDKIATGDFIMTMEVAGAASAAKASAASATQTAATTSPVSAPAPQAAASVAGGDMHGEVVVLGGGPGGYTAAFRAADLGKKVILIERYASIGGVCLNVGCIPSKALLHCAEVINEAQEMAHAGIAFGKPTIDINQMRDYKNSVITKLTGGLAALAKQRKVERVTGYGKFVGPNAIAVETADGVKTVTFDDCIIAAGSRVTKLPFIPWDDPRVMDSTDALEIPEVPERMLVIGGGIIGLEMATVYDALGAKITVVEMQDTIIPGADKDITRPLLKKIKAKYENIFLGAKVTSITPETAGLKVTFEGKGVPESDTFDRILVAIGRSPNGKLIDAEKAGLIVNDWGFIEANQRQETHVAHIYAIGDIIGQPMLAHKAVHEGKVAAEVIAGLPSAFTAMTIPSVAYTDPEVAWMGKTEEQLKAEGIAYYKGAFPWAASGRSLAIGRDEGLTKAMFCEETGRILGAGIVGPNAGELIAEAVLALEMGADAHDIGLSVHPHPTLSETLCFAAEMAEGTITDLMPPRKR